MSPLCRARSARTWPANVASRNAVKSVVDMARGGEGIEQFGTAADAHAIGSGRHAVAVLAEDDALAGRRHLPQPGEMAVLPAVAEELTHRRLVLVAREEGVGIGRRAPECDQGVVRPVGEVEATDEPRSICKAFHERSCC